MRSWKSLGVVTLAVLAVGGLRCDAAEPTAAGQSPEVERINGLSFVQVEAPSFNALPLKQKLVAYHLTQAAIQMDPIFYDQMSSYGLAAKRLLGGLVERPELLPAGVRPLVVEYAKLFFGNKGNHNETTNQKFLPRFTFEQLAEAAEHASAHGAHLGSAAALRQTLADLKAPLFDEKFEVSITEHSPPAGDDILTASANNYYRDVKLDDLKGFVEHYPLNSRLVKRNGALVEEVYRAGTLDGRITPGLYAAALRKVNEELERAATYAEPEQAAVLRALVRYYQTGDPKDWTAYNVLWVKSDPPVDLASGFIEVYRDARGIKGSSQMFVSVNNHELAPLMKSIADNAGYFEKRAPWEDRFKKPGLKPPVGKAIETVSETGDFSVATIGDNLPNEQDFREEYGTKSLLFVSSTRVFDRIRGGKVAAEFTAEPDEADLFAKVGTVAATLQTAMHEIIGHGSGKVVITQDPSAALRENYSTLEEGRADLVAYWNILDPKFAELGVKDGAEVAHEMYRSLARLGLTTLNHYPTGDVAEEDHDRDRLLIVNYLIEAGAMKPLVRNGHHYIEVVSDESVHAGVGKLLAEIMRIKATGDYEAGKNLVTRYGVHFDPATRDDVVARYKQLNVPAYFTGLYADLTLVASPDKEPKDVAAAYRRDFLGQQLSFARLNGTLGF